MANHVIVGNLGAEFDIGTIEANKIHIKLDGTLTRNIATGEIGLNGGAVTVVSADAGNILVSSGTDGGAFVDQAGIQAVETVWSGSNPDGFLTSTAGGTNGHTVTYGFDWTNAAFVEAVQDAIGTAALAGAGITYDDVANAISTSLGNITFGDGLNYNTGTNTVAVQSDPASPMPVTVSAAGVSVSPAYSADAGNLVGNGSDSLPFVDPVDVEALATYAGNDAFGVPLFKAYDA